MMDEFDADFDAASAPASAAADAAEPNEDLLTLPRLARFAVLGATSPSPAVRQRLAADVVGCKPRMRRPAERWAASGAWTDARSLAAQLDRAAAREDCPNLRSLATAVLLLSLRTADLPSTAAAEHHAVSNALLTCKARLPSATPVALRAEVDRIVCGWLALPLAASPGPFAPALALAAAVRLAGQLIESSVRAALDQRDRGPPEARADADNGAAPTGVVPPGHMMVGPMPETAGKFGDLIRGHEHVLGVPIPLVATPDLQSVRSSLLHEFPYAASVIDQILAGLVGRPFVQVPPTLFFGSPGSGKTRFSARLAQALGTPLWRTDGGQADGGSFAGTQRRWSTAEPCHAFQAISRGRVGNPTILVDEVDKAPDRRDHGRLWDSLLSFLEPESARAYPDPALQVDLDLSRVNIFATANSLDPLPSPLRDRLRIIMFPRPRAQDMDALLPAAILDLIQTTGMDERFYQPLSCAEAEILRAAWGGGSVRKLRRLLEALIGGRDRAQSRH
jgi:hypothetical protein